MFVFYLARFVEEASRLEYLFVRIQGGFRFREFQVVAYFLKFQRDEARVVVKKSYLSRNLKSERRYYYNSFFTKIK